MSRRDIILAGIGNLQNNRGAGANKIQENFANDEDLLNKYYNWYDNNNNIFSALGSTGNSVYNDFVNYQTNKDKQEMTNYMNQNFGGLGGSNLWLDKYWGATSDDEYVNNFIDTNYNNALEQLDRALKRGTLSQSGYNDALENLNTQKSGAYSTIGAIGQGIMDDYRNALTEKAQGFNSDIEGYNLGNRYDVSADKFQNSFNDLYNQQKQGFESQFNLMTQDINPFDVTAIIGDARVGQGVNNTQSDQLLGAIEDNEKKKSDKVGLGNQGMF